MAIEEESYAEFSRRLHAKAAGRRIPVNVDYDVTYRCNLNCRHCYCNLPANDAAAKEKELKLDEITRILTEARDLGALWILLTGGEPLLRGDFRDIYLTVLKLGLIPSVFTNGTLVTEEWADFFAKYRPFKIEITLYGSTPEVYERVTRTPGSFSACMRGIRLLKERGLSLSAKTMVLRSNREDLDGIRALAGSLELPFRWGGVLHRRYDDLRTGNGDSPVGERVPVEQAIELDVADADRWAQLRKCAQHLIGRFRPQRGRLVSCGAGQSSFSIASDGMVRPCSMLRMLAWSAKEQGLGRIWRHEMPERLAVPGTGPEPCFGCELASFCDQCAGWAWLEHGRLDQRVSYLCEIARARQEVLSPVCREEVCSDTEAQEAVR